MSVAGPYVARHPSPLRRPAKGARPPPSSYQAAVPPPPPPPADAYYGHGETAQLCQRFIQALFACPTRPPPSSASPATPTPALAVFVAYALHRTRLHASVTFTALFLLSRLKARFPAARGSSGHRLFISAFMIASKVVCDDTYSNKSWTVVGQGMFSLREINQMEREMCGYLEWLLNVDPADLRDFEARVRRDYAPNAPCPAFVHPPAPAPTPSPAAASAPAPHHIPPPAPSPPDVPLTPPDSPRRRRARAPSLSAAPAPPPVFIPAPVPAPPRPATPQLNPHSDASPSPASSTTCLTPQSDDEDDATIVSTYNAFSADPCPPAHRAPSRSSSALSIMSTASTLPPKSKIGRDPSFAFPSRTVW